MVLPDIDPLWDFGDPAGTEEKFRGLLPDAELAADRAYVMILWTQIARTYSLRRMFDEAHSTLDQVDMSVGPLVKVRALLERGRAFNSAEEQEKALPLFESAWDIAVVEGFDFFAADAGHMMAIASQGFEEQVRWHQKSLAFIDQSDDEKAKSWYGPVYNNLGWTYFDNGDFEKALDIFQQAVIWRKLQDKVAPLRIAHWAVARTLRALGRVEEALQAQETLLADYQSSGDQDGFVHEEIGECLLLLDRADEAVPHFVEAYRLLSETWVAEYEPERLERIKSLAG